MEENERVIIMTVDTYKVLYIFIQNHVVCVAWVMMVLKINFRM